MVGPKPPNTKQFEANLREYNSQIAAKKDEWISLVGNRSANIEGELDTLKVEIDAIKSELRDIRAKTNALKVDIEQCQDVETRKEEEIQEIRAEIPYPNKKQLEDVMRKVEKDYYNRTFSNAKDENTYVRHIDKLKKGYKRYGDYEQALAEKRDAYHHRKSLQRERDELHERGTALKKKLDRELRPQQKTLRLQRGMLRADLEELTQKKKSLRDDYDCAREEYRAHTQGKWGPYQSSGRHSVSGGVFRDKNENAEDLTDEFEPFDQEKRLCRTLVAFLRTLLPLDHQTSENDISPDRVSERSDQSSVAISKTDSLSSVPESSPSCVEGMMVLNKKVEPDTGLSLSPGSQSGVSKHCRKKRISKRDSKRRMNQPLTFHKELLDQFNELELDYPKTSKDIPKTIEALNDKLKFYEDQLGQDDELMSMIFETMSVASMGSYLSSDSDSALASFTHSYSDLSNAANHHYSSCSESNLSSQLASPLSGFDETDDSVFPMGQAEPSDHVTHDRAHRRSFDDNLDGERENTTCRNVCYPSVQSRSRDEGIDMLMSGAQRSGNVITQCLVSLGSLLWSSPQNHYGITDSDSEEYLPSRNQENVHQEASGENRTSEDGSSPEDKSVNGAEGAVYSMQSAYN